MKERVSNKQTSIISTEKDSPIDSKKSANSIYINKSNTSQQLRSENYSDTSREKGVHRKLGHKVKKKKRKFTVRGRNQVQRRIKDVNRCSYHFLALFKLEYVRTTTLKLFAVSICYFVNYMPWFLVNAYLNIGDDKSRQRNHDLFKYVYFPGRHLIFLGCAMNPLIYTFVDPKFRSQCKSLFR